MCDQSLEYPLTMHLLEDRRTLVCELVLRHCPVCVVLASLPIQSMNVPREALLGVQVQCWVFVAIQTSAQAIRAVSLASVHPQVVVQQLALAMGQIDV